MELILGARERRFYLKEEHGEHLMACSILLGCG
jgi:hypothetical protein